jgi:hypothetical protein
MTPISLSLPQNAIARGEILRSYAGIPQRLSEDILQVVLPTGYLIDVGWLPSFDPSGTFRITVSLGDWDNQVIHPIDTKNAFEVAYLVHELALEYSQSSLRPVSDPGAVDFDIKPATPDPLNNFALASAS